MAKNAKSKKLIHRLIQWLREHNFSGEDILDCIAYITK